MRHGQSEWNRLNLFTGWVDIPLSWQGIQESIEGGRKIAHLPIDVIFVSSLIRSQMTAMLAMVFHQGGKIPRIEHPVGSQEEIWAQVHSKEGLEKTIPVYEASEFNERMYGKLQGMNKEEMGQLYGKEQIQEWRRSFRGAPPEGESLEMTAQRTLPYFQQRVLPLLKEGKNVFIAAHGNSLRAIVMFLDGLSEKAVVELEIATGEPMIYSFFNGSWKKEAL
ncbi:MAG: histidine phosphatase family protein [Chlamydiales bacterium]|nr:histidine phosphatase family protein [Chlamydiales bacterium]